MWFHKSAKKDMLIYLLLGNTYREVFETEQMPLSVIDVFNGCSFTLVEGSTYKIVKSDESVNSFKIMDGVIPLATFYYGLGDQSENEIVRYVVSKRYQRGLNNPRRTVPQYKLPDSDYFLFGTCCDYSQSKQIVEIAKIVYFALLNGRE